MYFGLIVCPECGAKEMYHMEKIVRAERKIKIFYRCDITKTVKYECECGAWWEMNDKRNPGYMSYERISAELKRKVKK